MLGALQKQFIEPEDLAVCQLVFDRIRADDKIDRRSDEGSGSGARYFNGGLLTMMTCWPQCSGVVMTSRKLQPKEVSSDEAYPAAGGHRSACGLEILERAEAHDRFLDLERLHRRLEALQMRGL